MTEQLEYRSAQTEMSTIGISAITGISSHFGNSKSFKSKRTVTSTVARTRAINTALPNTLNQSYITYCAMYDFKGLPPKVGICKLDPNTSELCVTEVVDSQTYVRTIHMVNVYALSSQVRIIISEKNKIPMKTSFYKILESNIPSNVSICTIPETNFRCDDITMDHLCKHIKENEQLGFRLEISKRVNASAAVNGVLNYLLSSTDSFFSHEKFNIKYQGSDSHMFMPTSTIRDLELVDNKLNVSPLAKHSFLTFLNKTVTRMGGRMLKANILQPLTDKKSILQRQNAVLELMKLDDNTIGIQKLMKNLTDVDKLVSCLCKKPKVENNIFNDQRINLVLLLKQTINVGFEVCDYLGDLESDYLVSIHGTLQSEEMKMASNLINQTIEEEATWASKPAEIRNNKCHAIKAGYNGLLDAQRRLYKERVNDILSLIEKLGEDYDLSISNKYDNSRGFFAIIYDIDIETIEFMENHPFINLVQKGKNVECTTLDIIKLNNRVDSAIKEVFILSEETVDELISKLKKFSADYFMASEAFGLLDVLCCFSTICNNSESGPYAQPEINDSNIAIKESRHPILELMSFGSNQKVVPNDYNISFATSRMQIITGANMSGKTSYLKQFSYLIILTQIGMLVPAEYITTRIFKSLFSRIGNDASEPNMSTFSTEMVEMAFIIQHSNEDTLCIIDELGRGTSFSDGVSVSLALLEKLVELKSTCLIVTHFSEIPKILESIVGVSNIYMKSESENSNSKIVYKYKAEKGTNLLSGYGISMIENARLFPKIVIDGAKEITKQLRLEKMNVLSYSTFDDFKTIKYYLFVKYYEMMNYALHNVSDDLFASTICLIEDNFTVNYQELLNNYENCLEVAHVTDENAIISEHEC